MTSIISAPCWKITFLFSTWICDVCRRAIEPGCSGFVIEINRFWVLILFSFVLIALSWAFLLQKKNQVFASPRLRSKIMSVCRRTNTSGEPSEQRLPYLSLSCSRFIQGQTRWFKACYSSPGSGVLFHCTVPEENLFANSEFTREAGSM